ncbi:MAG: DUF1822 family protein [Cyanobacteria bacterium J06621_11]
MRQFGVSAVDLNAALKWVDAAVTTHGGNSLREPEIVILKGTWRGLTYEQMANDSEYSTNYLMRDVAPKLWKQLSNVFARSVGKTNFRVALESYAAANANLEPDVLSVADADLGIVSAGSPGFADEALAARRRESEQGWLTESAGRWGAVGASLLSAASMSPGVMYGYDAPLRQLRYWLEESAEMEGRSHLIGIWGLSGVGKTLLVETAVAQVGDRFEGLIWRSLQDQPTLSELSASILTSLGMVAPAAQATSQLLSVLSSRSLLIVLEGSEALLASGTLAGDYLSECQSYGDFFQSVASTRSSIVLIGIEGPAELLRQGGYGGNENVRSLTLSGLSRAAAVSLLESENLLSPEQWPELIERYQGHPLALKSVARVIREIFNGHVDAFLRQSSTLFNGIFRLLSPSFERLSLPEINILYWMASYESALSLSELQQTLPLAFNSSELISALDSLKQRSLIDIQLQADPPTFQLPALVKVYTVHQFMGQFTSERDNRDARWSISAMGAQPKATSAYPPVDTVIDLSPVPAKPVQLSQWFQGQFDADWHSLDWLFESSLRPAMRLRSAYHLRDDNFLKRCKPITFSSAPAVDGSATDVAKAVLLVAINQDSEDAYKVCVQAQPDRGNDVLPETLSLKLLDVNHHVLATVSAEQDDTFVQLPYFRGDIRETFIIELSLSGITRSETFVI